MSERRKLRGNELGKLQLYQQFWSFHRTTFFAFASLFLALEGIALVLAVFMRGFGTFGEWEMRIIGVLGICLGLVLLWPCYRALEQSDKWEEKMSEMAESTDIEDDLKPRLWRYAWWHQLYTVKRWGRLVWLMGPALLGVIWYFVAFRVG